MGKNVFANGREISAKADDNKSIAAMPDVCMSPPSPPAGPIPIPYPNFSDATKTSSGSKNVKIGGKELGLKNKSVYKNSKGDEAATRSFGMGMVTHTLSGATKHAAWSFDVKVEGQNVIRFLDLTTHNHSSDPMDTGATTIDVAKAKAAAGKPLSCEELDLLNEDSRTNELEKSKTPEGFALTTAVGSNAAGISGFMKAVSAGDAPKKEFKNGYAGPVKEKKRPECSGGGGYDAQRKNDSETKLLDPFMRSAGGGSVKMKVFHQTVKDNKKIKDSMPCISCRKSICGAEVCGIKVTLCNNKNEEVKAEDMCEDGKPKGTGSTSDPFWESKGFGPF